MNFSIWTLLSLFQLVGLCVGQLNCPIGAALPAPRNFKSSATWKKSTDEFQARLEKALKNEFANLNTSFSLNVFSAYDDDAIFEYHYQDPALGDALPEGKKLNGDTVYRIASVSKLLTTYTLLVERGFDALNEPIVKYVPEIADAINGKGKQSDDGFSPQWLNMTVGSVVSYLSGLGRDDITDIPRAFDDAARKKAGLPKLKPEEVPPCGIECKRKNGMQTIIDRHPVDVVYHAPTYSSLGYELLGPVLESMTDLKFADIVHRSLIEPLGLTRTSVDKPEDDSAGIIPGDRNTSVWYLPLDFMTPAGGYYSTTNDLAKIGQSILQSKLLSQADTRRWLKPQVFLSSLTGAVGASWEIYRLTKPRVINLYTKSGDLGMYKSMFALSPDHQAGFTLITASPAASPLEARLSDMVSGLLVPALEKVALEEAISKFAGTYVNTDSKEKSEITISKIDEPSPALSVKSWVLNGVDLGTTLGVAFGVPPFTNFTARLAPVELEEKYADPKNKSVKSRVAFRVISDVSQPAPEFDYETVFSSTCSVWFTPDGLSHGNTAMDEVIFELDEEGKALVLEATAWRMKLQRNM